MSWSDDKELSSEADAIGWNSLSQKKKKKRAFLSKKCETANISNVEIIRFKKGKKKKSFSCCYQTMLSFKARCQR